MRGLRVLVVVVAACGNDPKQPIDARGPDAPVIDAAIDAPAAAEPYTAVTAGNLHACAIATDGALYCWGANGRGELGDGTMIDHASPTRVGNTTWMAVAAGGSGALCSLLSDRRTCGGHTCGVHSDGTLWCWGRNAEGQVGDGTTTDRADPVQVGTASDWTSVATGSTHTCGIHGGALACWGANAAGQLGNNSTMNSLVPVAVANAGPWASVSVGAYHTCAIDSAMKLWCWGYGQAGALGIGSSMEQHVPVEVGGTWLAVSAGYELTYGIKSDHTLQSWGVSNPGLGRMPSTTSPQNVPGPISSAADWVSAVANHGDLFALHGCATNMQGELYCWGANPQGEIGADFVVDPAAKQTPQLVASGYAAAAAGSMFTCALGRDSAVRCFGSNRHGQLGIGTIGDRPAPGSAPNLAIDEHRETGNGHCARTGTAQACWGFGFGGTPVAAGTWQHLTSSGYSSCAIDGSGALYCWGRNNNGQLGLGDTMDRAQPTQVGTATDWTDIEMSSGFNFGVHACGIRGGHLLCWGGNAQGQVGNNLAAALAPVDVGGSVTWADVDVADGSSCALDVNGKLSCWGYNVSGTHFNVPTAVDANTWTSISLGAYHRCGVHDGQLYCWGSNYYGFLCRGSTVASATPLQVGTDTDWTTAFAGPSNTCAVKQDGSLYCCGRTVWDYVYGPSTDYVTTIGRIGTDTGWSSLQIGANHVCGMHAGALHCWGSNRYGQLGDGTGYSFVPQLVAPRM